MTGGKTDHDKKRKGSIIRQVAILFLIGIAATGLVTYFSQFYGADTAVRNRTEHRTAEITYSWLITRVNQIKRTYHIDYLFCVLTDDPYTRQFFLFSAAEPDSVRGTEYEQVYPLGVTVDVSESQTEAMESAVRHSSHIAEAGNYVDYYSLLCETDGHAILIGMTYNLSGLVRDVRNQTVRGTELAMAYQVILSVICLLSLFCFVLRPLREVMRNIRIYRNTKQSRDIVENLGTINVNNEIGELSEDIIDLTEEIDEHMERIRNITAETERISAELSLATKIQAAMLPHIFPPFPDHEEFEIYASMDPAREVGGDFYDFFLPDDDHLCMVMADVSGKGVPAALLMMASKIILQSCAMLGNGAAEILTRTNEAVCSNNPEEMFITAWVGILELSTGRLTAANAGHEYPVIKEPDRQFEMIRDKHGFVLGAMENMVYEEYEMMLEPGTKLFLYTDGVTEASDSGNNMFGTDRMLQALNKDNEAAPEQLLRNVRGAVDEFIGGTEQFDDLTMLCITYNGKDE